MADASDADAKTEAPTDKRRRESADKGEVLQARELGTALVVAAGVAWVMTAAAGLVAACRTLLRDGLSLGGPVDGLDSSARIAALADGLVVPLLVFAAFVVVGAVTGPLLTAPHFSLKACAIKLGRLDPLAGFKRIFGIQVVTESGKTLLKALLIFGAGIAVMTVQFPVLVTLGASDPAGAGARVGAAMTALLLALVAALGVIAAVDLPLQIMRHRAKLRMSKHEVREESKESEGSPETRAAQRRLARVAAKRAIAPAMAEASVVVVNPAHFAVALRYVPGRDAAPIVVAKGRDIIAAAIRDLAGEHRIPVLRYPQLTRAIFFTAAVGSPIRDDLFAAVAAVLAFVFSLDAAAARAQPEVEVPGALRFDESGAASS